jgi:hypothetical protein
VNYADNTTGRTVSGVLSGIGIDPTLQYTQPEWAIGNTSFRSFLDPCRIMLENRPFILIAHPLSEKPLRRRRYRRSNGGP